MSQPSPRPPAPADPRETPPHRYTAALAGEIETRWQARWEREGTFRQPNPGENGFDAARPKFYCLDMFPYPSGTGLHIGHPEGYTATDIISRFKRMRGFNVLHPMGWDAFGLPAEQYAIQTGIHPAETTRRAIETFRRQLKRFGFSYDWSREFGTIDEGYYRWTQWVFLRLYGAWYERRAGERGRARPIADLVRELEAGTIPAGTNPDAAEYGSAHAGARKPPVRCASWAAATGRERREIIDSYRLAYVAESTVNWCPKLGTALANEEVIDGKSERGGFPVFRKPLRQWLFRITAYADRLLEDLRLVSWPESTRTMQAEWIGRSEGAEIEFVLGGPSLRDGSGAPAQSQTAMPGVQPPRSGGPPRGGRFGGVALGAVLQRLQQHGPASLRPMGFVPRDPYPEGTHGPVRDLVRTRRDLPHLRLPEATYFVAWKTENDKPLSESERDVALSSLLHWDGKRCRVYAAVVTSNHVHWIVRPFEGASLDQLAESVKHFSATEINRARGGTGRLWQGESFDHIVRDAARFGEFVKYVLENPVEAGVVNDARDYEWAFVHHEALGDLPEGADAAAAERRPTLRVFTTRPDTIFGATFMVVAPEHPLVEDVLKHPAPETDAAALRAYVAAAKAMTDVERQEGRAKTGVFTGVYATNPATGRPIPVWAADYVLMGYGTGAIMAVPGQDQRDWEFARAFGLPIVRTVQPPEGFEGGAYVGDGPAINSGFLNGLPVAEAKKKTIAWLEETGRGARRVNYRLRDWLFSRQRYWGEPFPVVFDAGGDHHAVGESALPVRLPELKDFAPEESDEPRPLLAKAAAWVTTTAGAAGVPTLPPEAPVRRETNTMPNWAGSCWYYLRFCDPRNAGRFVGREAERYWMDGGVDLYIGGAEHAVLHLLYARFWHKALFDLGEVSTPEPFSRLFHQGLITSFAYQRPDRTLVPSDAVEEAREGEFVERATGQRVSQITAKMSKSLKNVVNPDEVIAEYGADTVRLYEMYMGPLEASKPWNPRDISGLFRFLQRAWRLVIDERSGQPRLREAADPAVERQLHRATAKAAADIERLAFNTAIAALIEFVNAATAAGGLTRDQAGRFALVLCPFAPHVAEEIWSRLGHATPASLAPWPPHDEAMLRDDTIEIPVQVGGKVRARLSVPANATPQAIEAAALADEKIRALVEGKTVRKVVVVPGKMVNLVVG